MTSRVTMHGVRSPLREGQIVLAEKYVGQENWYVGGQSAFSWYRAWQLLESLLDGPEGWGIDPMWQAIGECASGRFGNCLHVRVECGERLKASRAFWFGLSD